MRQLQRARWQIIVLACGLLLLLATSAVAAPIEPISSTTEAAAPMQLTEPEIVLASGGTLTTWQITAGFIYFCTNRTNAKLSRRPIEGQLVTEFNVPCNQVHHFQADGSGVYYYDAGSDQIKAVYTDNPNATPLPIASIGNPMSARLGLDGAFVYWIESTKVSGDDVDAIYAHTVRRTVKSGPSPATIGSYQGGAIGDGSRVGLQGNYVWWVAQDGLHRVRKPTLQCGISKICPVSTIAGLTVTNGKLSVTPNGDILWWGDVLQPDQSSKRQLLRTRCNPCLSFVRHNAASGATIYAATTDVDGEFGYVVESNRLLRVDMSTTQPEPIADAIANFPDVVTVDGAYVYFTRDTSTVARLALDAAAIDRDLRVSAMEITQAIQNLDNDVPLVAGKTTFVRLYATVGSGDDGAAAVEAALRGFRSGIELPGSPLKPIRRTIVVGESFDRTDDQAAWLFRLPYDWVRPPFEDLPQSDVTLTLQGTVDPRNINIDRDRANNNLWEAVTFTAKGPVCLEMYQVLSDGLTQPLDSPMVNLSTVVAEAMLPAPRVMAFNHDPILAAAVQQCPLSQSPTGICMTPYILDLGDSAILSRLERLGTFTDDPVSCANNNGFTHQAGIVHPDANWGFGGLGRRPGAPLLAKVPSPPSSLIPRFTSRAVTLAEEMGHNYGRMHVNCGGPATWGFYPYNPAMLDDEQIDSIVANFGFDPLTRQVLDPRANQDFMGYCRDEWISDFTWRNIFVTFEAPTGSRFSTDQQKATPEAVVIVSGVIDTVAGQSALDYAWSYVMAEASPGLQQKWSEAIADGQGVSSNYHLQLLDGAGQLVHDQPIALSELSIPQNDQPFTAIFAKPLGVVQRLQLVHNGTVLATRDVGSTSPTVELLEPTGESAVDDEVTIVWRGDDADSADALRYGVQYSPDQGGHWYPLLLGLEGASGGVRQEVKLSLAHQAGSNGATALLRVLTSDGYNTGVATSVPFSVAPRDPEATITLPTAGQWHGAGVAVTLRGRATDPEDGVVSDDKLVWSGLNIGATGSTAEISGLAPGTHTVTLQATDGSEAQGSTQTTFSIAPLNVPSVDDALNLDGRCDDSRYDQAEVVPLEAYGDGTQATAHLVHTDNHLWVCLQGLKKGEGRAGVVIDVNDSGDDKVKNGDLAYFVSQNGTPAAFAGDDSGNFVGSSPRDFSSWVSEGDAAWTAELRINGNKLEGWDHRVGLAAIHQQGQGSEGWGWPVTAKHAEPGSWGQTNLGLAPSVSALEPAIFTRGQAATEITVMGSGFTAQSQVVWQGTPLATTLINNSTLKAMVEAGLLNQAGYITVEVVNTVASALKSWPNTVTVQNPQPTISSITPNLADAGAATINLTVNGTDFVDGTVVYWNDQPKPTTVVNGGQLEATLSTTDLLRGGAYQIRVRNPEPSAGISNMLPFTVVNSASPPNVRLYLPVVLK